MNLSCQVHYLKSYLNGAFNECFLLGFQKCIKSHGRECIINENRKNFDLAEVGCLASVDKCTCTCMYFLTHVLFIVVVVVVFHILLLPRVQYLIPVYI